MIEHMAQFRSTDDSMEGFHEWPHERYTMRDILIDFYSHFKRVEYHNYNGFFTDKTDWFVR